MTLDDTQDAHAHHKLHSTKDRIFEQLRKVLDDAGLHDYEIKSIGLYLKHGLRCPAGQKPVWVTVAKPDGTVVSEWVCK